MTSTEGIDLTAIFRREGILSVTDNGRGFSVYMRGNIMGTGKTVGEAYQAALQDKAARAFRVAA